jgi:protein-disulfide isomerase
VASVTFLAELHFSQRRVNRTLNETRVPVLVDDWQEVVSSGIRIGQPDAAVTIAEFVDFECPACASFGPVLDQLRSEYIEDIAIVFHHFPLARHRFSRTAAAAAECAARQGRFGDFARLLLASQQMFGLKQWVDFAQDVGVPDLAEFDKCREADVTAQRIEHALAFGRRIGVDATPTVIVNGWMMPGVPTLEELRQKVAEALAEPR